MPRVYRHKHWPEDHPYYSSAPWHEGTKKACDTEYTQFHHGHAGRECVMEFPIAKKTSRRADGTVITQKGEQSRVASCTIVTTPEHGLSFEGLLRAAEEQKIGTNV